MLQRNRLFLGLAVGFLCFAFQAANGEEKQDPKIFKQVGLSNGGGAIGPLRPSPSLVIRNARELAEHCDPERASDRTFQFQNEKELAEFFKVPGIDWEKHMVVAVAPRMMAQRSPLPPVFFHSLKEVNGQLVVSWRLEGQEGDWIPSPIGVALVDRFDGTVVIKGPGRKGEVIPQKKPSTSPVSRP